jgi:hypothetical protein
MENAKGYDKLILNYTALRGDSDALWHAVRDLIHAYREMGDVELYIDRLDDLTSPRQLRALLDEEEFRS